MSVCDGCGLSPHVPHKNAHEEKGHFYGVRGVTVRNRRTQTNRVNSLRRRSGGEAFSPNGVYRGGRPAECPQSLHVRTQRVHGTIEDGSTRGQGTIEAWVS